MAGVQQAFSLNIDTVPNQSSFNFMEMSKYRDSSKSSDVPCITDDSWFVLLQAKHMIQWS